jgi:hypothetical protein
VNLRKAILVLTAFTALGLATPARASLNADVNSAAAGGDFNGVMTSLQLGADPNTRDRVGRTPLGWAARGGYTRVAAYLLDHGAAINALDGEGYTPLMWAARAGQFETVALLVSRGANPVVRNWQGQDALSLAHGSREWRSEDMIYRYLHGQTVGQAPKPHRASPTLGTAAVSAAPAAAKPAPLAAKPAPSRPTPPTPLPNVPVPQPVAFVPAAAGVVNPAQSVAAPAPAPQEPNLLVKAMALKKLAEAALRAKTEVDNFVKANSSNPMALMDPDLLLGKELVTMYANVTKTQSLIECRADFTRVKTQWGNRAGSRFAQNIADVEAILKEAGI